MPHSSASDSKTKEAQYRFGRLMREINRKITAGDDYKCILDFLFDSLTSVIPYDRIGIAVIEGGQLCSKWMKSRMPSTHLGVGYCGPLAGSSLQNILDTGRPRILNDLVQYSLQNPESESTRLALADGIRSSLTCPLYSRGKPMGIVFFSSGSPDTYRDEHIEIYLEIADELSFVMDQDQVRRQAAGVSSTRQNVRMLLHDLKSPLSIIQGFLQIAQEETWYEKLDDDAKSIFATLRRNAVHMQELLAELAELNQLKLQDQGTIQAQDVELRTFIAEAAQAGREMAAKKSIAFDLNMCVGTAGTVRFDPLKIRRALDNLLSNAVKYSPRQTQVRLSVERAAGRLRFEVADQGLGIPEAEFSKLFQEFGKTSVRPTEGESSTGIGLAIVKKIVEQHGGQVSMRSQVGRGSAFGFWIPEQ